MSCGAEIWQPSDNHWRHALFHPWFKHILEKQKLCGEISSGWLPLFYRVLKTPCRKKMLGPIRPPGAVQNGLFAQKVHLSVYTPKSWLARNLRGVATCYRFYQSCVKDVLSRRGNHPFVAIAAD